MNDVLDLKLGSPRKSATVKKLWLEETAQINDTGEKKSADKLHFRAESSDGAPYDISEIWLYNHKNELITKPLFVNRDFTNEAIHPTSALGKLMKFFQITELKEFIGKDVYLEPKPNGFFAVVTYENGSSGDVAL